MYLFGRLVEVFGQYDHAHEACMAGFWFELEDVYDVEDQRFWDAYFIDDIVDDAPMMAAIEAAVVEKDRQEWRLVEYFGS